MISIISLASFLLLFSMGAGPHQEVHAGDHRLILEATVVQIGSPPMRDAGDVDVYQLVKYKVRRLCKGEYGSKEIVVDHLLTRHDQLKDLKVGKQVCLSVLRSKTIGLRYNAEGIRSPSEVPEAFFIAQDLKLSGKCPCL